MGTMKHVVHRFRRALSRRDERGFTLVEMMLAITISSIILIPVMAWSVLAMNRANETDITDGTKSTALLNRYLKSDVAGSSVGQGSPDAVAWDCAAPIVGGSLRLSLVSSDRATLTSYVAVPRGFNDPDTNDPVSTLERRQCNWDVATQTGGAVTSTSTVSDYLTPDPSTNEPVQVTCGRRDDIREDAEDPCGKVTMTINAHNAPATVRAARRIDPPLQDLNDRRPVAVIKCDPACPANGVRRFAVRFDSRSSNGNESGGASWDFGDGTSTNDEVASHTYTTLGTFNVKLTVWDEFGAYSVARTTVTVRNALPVAVATPLSVVTNRVDYVPFSAETSTDPDADPAPGLTYLWDFGDGVTSNSATPPGGHRYTPATVPRSYTATLTVSDADGATDVVTIPVRVENKAPIACFTTNQTAPPAASPNPGACLKDPVEKANEIGTDTDFTTITFDSATPALPESRDDDGSIVARIWYVGTGQNAPTQSGTGNSLTRTFTAGLHTVILEVFDNDGASSRYAIQIEVNKKPQAVIKVVGNPPTCVFNVRPGTCTLDSSDSADADGTIASVLWDFGDGSTSTALSPTHTWTDFGTYAVTLTVTDDVGSTSTASLRAKVNAAPVAAIGPGGGLNALRKKAFNFIGTGSSDDPTGAIVSYAWNFGDSLALPGTNTSNLANPSYAYQSLGSKTVRLTVCDDNGLCSTTQRTVNVTNQSPTAVISSSTGTVAQGLIAYLNGSGSTDPDGTITTYFWEFGDGTTSTEANPTKTYGSYGEKTVRLTVTDNDGAGNTRQIALFVNRLPTANFTSSRPWSFFTENPPLHLDLDASGSSDPDGTIVNYSWNFGPVIGSAAGKNMTVDYTEADRGRQSVTLTVTDNRGGTATITQELAVINRRPVAVITPTPTSKVVSTAPMTFGYSSVGSVDPDGTIVSYLWDFGDGTTSNAVSPSKTYPATTFRNYTVTLTLTDNHGVTGTASTVVKVNAPPTAVIGGPTPLKAGRNIPFTPDGTGSFDSDGNITTWVWDWGDGSPLAYGATPPPKSYSTIGLFTLTLTVTDNDGKVGIAATRTVDTSNALPLARMTMTGATATNPATCGVTCTRLVSNLAPSFTVTFDGSASTDPDDATPGAITNYAWNFGDGSPVVNTTSPTVSRTYTDYGTWTNVSLTVTDRNAGTNKTPNRTIKVNRLPVVSFTPDYPQVVGPTLPFDVAFDGRASSDVDGTVASYRWVVDGTGQTFSAANFTRTYNSTGEFLVRLTVTDNDGGATTLDRPALVRANRPPTAVITNPVSSSARIDNAEPFAWTFTHASTDADGTIAGQSWDFGDGNTSTDAAPTYTYANAGVYTVKLTVTDNNGVSSTAQVVVTANAAPTAVIGPDVLDPKISLPFTFDGSGSTDPAPGSITTYIWTFPGAIPATSNVARPVVTWATAGPRTVTLVVGDNNGRVSAPVTRTVNVVGNVAPTAAFSITPDPANGYTNPFNVTVDGSASTDPDGSIVRWDWNFGDGGTATGATATRPYTTYGTFTVTLTVTDNSGVTATATRSVRHNRPPVIQVATLPTPAIFNDPTCGVGCWSVFFNAAGTSDPDGTIVSYSWDFDDGTTATGLSTTHQFTARDIFDVVLTVTDNEGGISTRTVPVKVNKPPVAVITPPSQTPRLLPVAFNGLGSNDPDGTVVLWEWNFGDGRTGAGATVEHTFIGLDSNTATPALDPYVVTLTVTDDNGGRNSTTYSVQTTNQAPIAAILTAPNPPIGDPGFAVTFNGGGSYDPDGTLTSYAWNYGDGGTATGLSPAAHTFAAYGTYQVTLTVTDNNGGTAVSTVAVKVNRPPEPTIGPAAPMRGIPFTFAGGGTDPDGSIASYRWDFADGAGSISTQQNPTYTYQTYGTKIVTLAATDNNGRAATASRTITVGNQLPVATLTATSDTTTPNVLQGAGPMVVSFDGSGSSDPDNALDGLPGTVISSYTWNFGDGSPAETGPSPTIAHTYTAIGSHTATLTVQDSDGGTKAITRTVTIVANTAPTAQFTATPPSGANNVSVFFDGSTSSDSDGRIVTYTWDFGDGTTATGATASRNYGPGQWTARLTVRDNSNATGTTTRTISVSGALSAPTGLRLVSRSGGTTNWAWDPLPGATRYEIFLDNVGGINIFCGSGNDESGSFNAPSVTGSIGGLCGGRDWEGKIRAFNGGEAGPWSPTVSFGT